MTTEMKQSLMTEFQDQLDDFNFGELNFSKKFETKNSDKIHILYTPEAFAKTVKLIHGFTTEVAWHCLIHKVDEKIYEVYDVFVYPQIVGAATVRGDVERDDSEYLKWKISLTDEEDANLFGQCHSHVDMGVFASGTDLKQQHDEIALKGRTGFYLFQIWNKKLQIASFFYDLDNNKLYEGDEVVTDILAGETLISSFVEEAHDIVDEVVSKKPAATKAVTEKTQPKKEETKAKKKEEDEVVITKEEWEEYKYLMSLYDGDGDDWNGGYSKYWDNGKTSHYDYLY